MVFEFRKSGVLRLSALVVAFNMFVTTVAWSAPTLPALMPPSDLEARMMSGLHPESPFLDILGALPGEIGYVQNVVGSEQEQLPFVVHIRDMHANPEAQQNIFYILKHLAQNAKATGASLQVAVEGASGELHPEYFDFFPEYPEAGERVVQELLNQGELTGAELFAWRRYRDAKVEGGTDIPVFGVEKPELYRKNLSAYRALERAGDAIEKSLLWLNAELETERSKLDSMALRDFLKERARRKQGKFGPGRSLGEPNWLAYLDYIRGQVRKTLNVDLENPIEQLRFPNLIRMLALQETETFLDGRRASREWQTLLDELWTNSTDRNDDELFEELRRFGVRHGYLQAEHGDSKDKAALGSFYPRMLLERVYLLAKQRGLDLGRFSQFFLTFRVFVYRSEINAVDLMQEVERLEAVLIDRFAQTERDKGFVRKRGDLDLVEKLLRRELTRDEWNEIRSRSAAVKDLWVESEKRDKLGRARLWSRAHEFYDSAWLRDEFMLTHALESVAATRQKGTDRSRAVLVIVAGGFHTEGLRAALEDAGAGYAIVSPNGAGYDHGDLYREVMSGRHADLKGYFEGKYPFETRQEALLFKGLLEWAAPVLTGHYGLKTARAAHRMMTALSAHPVFSKIAQAADFTFDQGTAMVHLNRSAKQAARDTDQETLVANLLSASAGFNRFVEGHRGRSELRFLESDEALMAQFEALEQAFYAKDDLKFWEIAHDLESQGIRWAVVAAPDSIDGWEGTPPEIFAASERDRITQAIVKDLRSHGPEIAYRMRRAVDTLIVDGAMDSKGILFTRDVTVYDSPYVEIARAGDHPGAYGVMYMLSTGAMEKMNTGARRVRQIWIPQEPDYELELPARQKLHGGSYSTVTRIIEPDDAEGFRTLIEKRADPREDGGKLLAEARLIAELYESGDPRAKWYPSIYNIEDSPEATVVLMEDIFFQGMPSMNLTRLLDVNYVPRAGTDALELGDMALLRSLSRFAPSIKSPFQMALETYERLMPDFYLRRQSVTPPDFLDRYHFRDKLDNRFAEARAKSEKIDRLFAAPYIKLALMNREPTLSPNLPVMLEVLRLITPLFPQIFLPPYLSQQHGDLHFGNILADPFDFIGRGDLGEFKLVDPKNIPEGNDPLYDFAKLMHNLYGGYDLVVTHYKRYHYEIHVDEDAAQPATLQEYFDSEEDNEEMATKKWIGIMEEFREDFARFLADPESNPFPFEEHPVFWRLRLLFTHATLLASQIPFYIKPDEDPHLWKAGILYARSVEEFEKVIDLIDDFGLLDSLDALGLGVGNLWHGVKEAKKEGDPQKFQRSVEALEAWVYDPKNREFLGRLAEDVGQRLSRENVNDSERSELRAGEGPSVKFLSKPRVNREEDRGVLEIDFRLDRPEDFANLNFFVHWGSYSDPAYRWTDDEVTPENITDNGDGTYTLTGEVRPGRAGLFGLTVYVEDFQTGTVLWQGNGREDDAELVIDGPVVPFGEGNKVADADREAEKNRLRGVIRGSISDYDDYISTMHRLVRDDKVRGTGKLVFEAVQDDEALLVRLFEHHARLRTDLATDSETERDRKLPAYLAVETLGVGEVVFVSPEASHAIAGGLAKVMEGLSRALVRSGISVTVITTLYEKELPKHHESAETVLRDGFRIHDEVIRLAPDPVGEVTIPFGPTYRSGTHITGITDDKVRTFARIIKAKVYEANDGGVRYLFLRHRRLGDELYPQVSHSEELKRTIFLSRGSLEILKDRSIGVDAHVISAHDWMASLIPLFFRRGPRYNRDPYLQQAETMFTIHNYPPHFQKRIYTNEGDIDLWPFLNLPNEYEEQGRQRMTYDLVKDPNDPDHMNLVASTFAQVTQALTTMSKLYAEQMLTPEGGEGLDKNLREYSDRLFGISNGIDQPAFRRILWGLSGRAPEDFSNEAYLRDLPAAKAETKRRVQKKYGLEERDDAILLSMVGRLSDQKGLPLLTETDESGETVLEKILKKDERIQIFIAGPAALSQRDASGTIIKQGDATADALYQILPELTRRYPGRIYGQFTFVPIQAAWEVMTGSDFFLMPSRYEPGGITQMEALAGGALVIGRGVGGLAATLNDYDEETDKGDAFLFYDYTGDALLQAVTRAVAIKKRNGSRWDSLTVQAAQAKHDWSDRTPFYLPVYQLVAGMTGPDGFLTKRAHLSPEISNFINESKRVLDSSRPDVAVEPDRSELRAAAPSEISTTHEFGLDVRRRYRNTRFDGVPGFDPAGRETAVEVAARLGSVFSEAGIAVRLPERVAVVDKDGRRITARQTAARAWFEDRLVELILGIETAGITSEDLQAFSDLISEQLGFKPTTAFTPEKGNAVHVQLPQAPENYTSFVPVLAVVYNTAGALRLNIEGITEDQAQRVQKGILDEAKRLGLALHDGQFEVVATVTNRKLVSVPKRRFGTGERHGVLDRNDFPHWRRGLTRFRYSADALLRAEVLAAYITTAAVSLHRQLAESPDILDPSQLAPDAFGFVMAAISTYLAAQEELRTAA
ncbi:MAG: glycogen/starch synthase [Candidatus Omnitrophota bacterium]|nr:glycogen/starch synthase [Candidatus Omnitrophota bacterium]